MSQKKDKFKVIEPVRSNKKKKKSKLSHSDSFIVSDSDIDDDEKIPPKMRRLKKLKDSENEE